VDNAQKVGSLTGAERRYGGRRKDEANELHETLAGLRVRQVVSQFESMGVPRRDAIQRAVGYSRTAAWRRFRQRRSEPASRRPRWRRDARTVIFELLACGTRSTPPAR
jgi:hypothetical protein